MASQHSDVAAELWALAETVLTRLEPMLRQVVEDQGERSAQGCSWCPVCALAALMRGEQHDLLTLLATEGATVVAAVRQLLAEHGTGTRTAAAQPEAPGETAPSAGAATPASGADHIGEPGIANDTEKAAARRAKYEPITVTVRNSNASDSKE